MSAVVVPLPIERIDPPERCLVTGRTEGVQLRPAAVEVWFRSTPRPALPLTEVGQARLERRVRGARGLALAAVVVSGVLAAALSVIAAGAGGFLALILLVVGWIGARWWRRQELHALAQRHDLLTLDVPDPEVAAGLREAVARAELPEDVRARLDSAQHLGNLEAERHPIAR